MSLIDFDYLPVTTMTFVISLKGMVNILQAFPLLEITRMQIEETSRRRQKFKIPYPGFAGAILSATYGGFTRGIVRSINPFFFRNSITIDVSTANKNVNVKLSKTGIQMCGPTSEEMALEAANHIINNLHRAQDMIDYIKEHREAALFTLEWVKEETKGSSTLVVAGSDIIVDPKDVVFYPNNNVNDIETSISENDNGLLIFSGESNISCVDISHQKEVDSNLPANKLEDDTPENSTSESAQIVGYLVPPSNPETTGSEDQNTSDEPTYVEYVQHMKIPDEYTVGYPAGVDENIANFLINQAPDFSRHDFFCLHLNWLMTLDEIIQRPLEVDMVKKAMVNYNYDLGFNVDRWELCTRINGYRGFTAQYENTTDHSVTIHLPYDIPDHLVDVISKKNKSTKHTFLVYKSGLVTQSGPCEELCREAYNYFNDIIRRIRPYIIGSRGTRMIKYLSIDDAQKTRARIVERHQSEVKRREDYIRQREDRNTHPNVNLNVIGSSPQDRSDDNPQPLPIIIMPNGEEMTTSNEMY